MMLDAYLASAQPFNWATHNCAHFAAGWVRLKTGRDVLSEWLGTMQNTRAALRALHRAGGYKAAADRALGAHLSGAYAARGDVVLLQANPVARLAGRYCGMAWGICTGRQIAALGKQGLLMLPITAGSAAWRV